MELLQPLLPAALLPAASPSGECTNWLAYARSSSAATDLRLQGSGPVGAWGFTKSAAALRPVYLSLPLGPQTQVRSSSLQGPCHLEKSHPAKAMLSVGTSYLVRISAGLDSFMSSPNSITRFGSTPNRKIKVLNIEVALPAG